MVLEESTVTGEKHRKRLTFRFCAWVTDDKCNTVNLWAISHNKCVTKFLFVLVLLGKSDCLDKTEDLDWIVQSSFVKVWQCGIISRKPFEYYRWYRGILQFSSRHKFPVAPQAGSTSL